MTSLEKARQIINETDAKMAKLFVERMKASKTVAEYKKEHGLQIFDAKREEEVIRKNSQLVEDKEIREYYINFLKGNMAISRDYQERLMNGMKVAFSGTKGAFAYIAAGKAFAFAKKTAFSDFETAYKSVENGECDSVVLPVENSFNGEVGQVTDLIFLGSLYINNIFELEVTQDLLAVPGAKLSDIKLVISHPQALGQCAEYIKKKGFETREYANTALAAQKVAELSDKSVAAIASSEAAELFGLEVLEKNINSSKSNTTRFAVLSRAENVPNQNDSDIHTVLLFAVKNEAGSLAKAIEVIGRHGFNMISLRSRPMRGESWQYYFYVEVEGNVHTEAGKNMMKELECYCDRLKSAGTFKKEQKL